MLAYTEFDSAQLAPGDGFEAWRQSIAPVFEVSPLVDEDAIRTRVEGFHLGAILAGTVCTGAQHFRQAHKSRRVDHILIQVHRSGGYRGRLGEQDTTVAPGHVSVIDLAQPLETRAGSTDIVNLVIPREAFDERPSALNGIHGLVLTAERGAFLVDYIHVLMRRLPTLPVAEAPAVARITRDMVLANLAPESEARARVQSGLAGLARDRVARYIDERLSSPQLTPTAICRENGLSRSSLYRLFEPDGGVQRYIQRCRLRRIRRHLQDPRDPRPVGRLAEDFGFSSQAHFSRRFRDTFGHSPTELRQNADAPVTGRLDDWIRRLGLPT